LFDIENNVSGMTTGLFVNGFLATTPFDTPNIIICSLAEMEATTPSAELQAYKNMNVSSSFCFNNFRFFFLSIKHFIEKIFYMIQLLKVQ
jgi:hypothetical protein